MGHYRVLIVDDDETVLNLLGRSLNHSGYAVESAADSGNAIHLIKQSPFDAVVTDVKMPGLDGIELLDWITTFRSETAVVILSGCDDVKLAVEAMKRGALDYIEKPCRLEEVVETLGRAIAKKKVQLARERYLADLEMTFEHQAGQLRSTVSQLQEASQETLEALVAALDARERETHAHSRRVSDYSVSLAREMGVSGTDLQVIRQGSMLHDIGKIGIPDRILLKPDPLDETEWREMRKHPGIGAWIVGGVESLKPAAGIVIAHHERFDGQGYPHGLAGDEIPLGARVFAIADTLDAVISDRPYRCGQSLAHAREEIAKNAGSQFDPLIADCFLKMPAEVWNAGRERSLSQESSLIQQQSML